MAKQPQQPQGGKDERKITPRAEDYSRWYLDIIREAQLADHSAVRGCMVIKPAGYAIWDAAALKAASSACDRQ